MSTSVSALTYNEIFERQGIDEDLRGPDNFFIHEVTEDESDTCGGEKYAIPRQLVDQRGYIYNHHENGALVNTHTDLADNNVEIGSRAIIDAAAIKGYSRIGRACVIGAGGEIFNSLLDRHVVIGAGAKIIDAKISEGVTIGRNASLSTVAIHKSATLGDNVDIVWDQRTTDPTVIESEAVLQDRVELDGANSVGYGAILRTGVVLGPYAVIGSGVELGDSVTVAEGAEVGDGSYVMPGLLIRSNRKIKSETIVVPAKYKRTRKA